MKKKRKLHFTLDLFNCTIEFQKLNSSVIILLFIGPKKCLEQALMGYYLSFECEYSQC